MSDERQLTTFYLDGLLFGVEVSKVQEVIRYQVTGVPLAHPVVQGLINLRGQIVTALDLRRRLAMTERASEEKSFERPPETLQGEARDLIRGAYKLKDRLLLVLDTEKAVSIAA